MLHWQTEQHADVSEMITQMTERWQVEKARREEAQAAAFPTVGQTLGIVTGVLAAIGAGIVAGWFAATK